MLLESCFLLHDKDTMDMTYFVKKIKENHFYVYKSREKKVILFEVLLGANYVNYINMTPFSPLMFIHLLGLASDIFSLTIP